MNTDPKSRQQKILDAMSAFFGDMKDELTDDTQPLRICNHLLTLGEEVMGNHFTLSFIDLWSAEYAEEEDLSCEEVLWGLSIFRNSMPHISQARHLEKRDGSSTHAKLRVINGGLSANPDRPYVAPQVIELEYDF